MGGDARAAGAGRRLEMRLAPGHRVPLRDQIAAQLAAGVRAGDYGPGDRLPSVRRLSSRLAVHRDTVRAAYRALAGRGLVEIRPGSGVYVTRPERNGFRGFLAREREAGRSFADVARLVQRWRRSLRSRHVTLVGPDAGLREVWADELRPGLEAEGVGLSVLAPADLREAPERLSGTLVAGPPGALDGLDDVLPRWAATVQLRPGPSPRLRRLLLRLPEGAVVALVTRSDTFARQVRELGAGLRDGEVAVRPVGPRRDERFARTIRVARFVLADVSCRRDVRGFVESERLLTVRHLPVGLAREMARCFGPPAEEAPGDVDVAPRARRQEGASS